MMNDVITIDTDVLTGTKIYEPYELVPETSKILTSKAQPFDFSKENAKEISERLKKTLLENRALGVAAPQCGIPLRVFCMGAEGEYITLFNPEIVYRSENTSPLEEACLSFPFLTLNVVRPVMIEIRFQDEKENWQNLTLSGLSSKIAQHEYDHLEGTTFNKVAKPLALKMGLKKREKQMRNYARFLISQGKVKNEKSI